MYSLALIAHEVSVTMKFLLVAAALVSASLASEAEDALQFARFRGLFGKQYHTMYYSTRAVLEQYYSSTTPGPSTSGGSPSSETTCGATRSTTSPGHPGPWVGVSILLNNQVIMRHFWCC